MFFATTIGDIFFFSIIQMRFFEANSPTAAAGLFISLTMLLLSIIFMMLTYYLASESKRTKARDNEERSSTHFQEFAQEYRSYQVLFGGCNPSSGLMESFFLIYIIRLTIPMIIAATLVKSPIAQAIIYLILNILIISYIVLRRPIKHKINCVNLLLIEIAMLVANICALILSSHGTVSDSYVVTKMIDSLSEVILFCSIFIEFIALIFLIIKVVLVAVEALKYRKEMSKLEGEAWLQLLFVPLRQGFMCFEEIQITESPPDAGKQSKAFTTQIIPHNNRCFSATDEQGLTAITPVRSILQLDPHRTTGLKSEHKERSSLPNKNLFTENQVMEIEEQEEVFPISNHEDIRNQRTGSFMHGYINRRTERKRTILKPPTTSEETRRSSLKVQLKDAFSPTAIPLSSRLTPGQGNLIQMPMRPEETSVVL